MTPAQLFCLYLLRTQAKDATDFLRSFLIFFLLVAGDGLPLTYYSLFEHEHEVNFRKHILIFNILKFPRLILFSVRSAVILLV